MIPGTMSREGREKIRQALKQEIPSLGELGKAPPSITFRDLFLPYLSGIDAPSPEEPPVIEPVLGDETGHLAFFDALVALLKRLSRR